MTELTGDDAPCSDLCYCERAANRAEIERLRAAVWAAIPWLDDLEHMGSLVDQDRRAKTAATLAAAVRAHEQRGVRDD